MDAVHGAVAAALLGVFAPWSAGAAPTVTADSSDAVRCPTQVLSGICIRPSFPADIDLTFDANGSPVGGFNVIFRSSGESEVDIDLLNEAPDHLRGPLSIAETCALDPTDPICDLEDFCVANPLDPSCDVIGDVFSLNGEFAIAPLTGSTEVGTVTVTGLVAGGTLRLAGAPVDAPPSSYTDFDTFEDFALAEAPLVTVLPEPSKLVLALAGAVGLAGLGLLRRAGHGSP